jgi:hypothetical protein
MYVPEHAQMRISSSHPVSIYIHPDRLPSIVNYATAAIHDVMHDIQVPRGFIGVRYDAEQIDMNEMEKRRDMKVRLFFTVTPRTPSWFEQLIEFINKLM